MERKEYESPEIEVIKFKTEDIITVSGKGGIPGPEVPIGG